MPSTHVDPAYLADMRELENRAVVVDDLVPHVGFRKGRGCVMLKVGAIRCYDRAVVLHIVGHVTLFYWDEVDWVLGGSEAVQWCNEASKRLKKEKSHASGAPQTWAATFGTELTLDADATSSYGIWSMSTAEPLHSLCTDLRHLIPAFGLRFRRRPFHLSVQWVEGARPGEGVRVFDMPMEPVDDEFTGDMAVLVLLQMRSPHRRQNGGSEGVPPRPERPPPGSRFCLHEMD